MPELDPNNDADMGLLNEKCHELRKSLGLAPDHMRLTRAEAIEYLGLQIEAGNDAVMLDSVVELKILLERRNA